MNINVPGIFGYLLLSGGTLTGDVSMANNKLYSFTKADGSDNQSAYLTMDTSNDLKLFNSNGKLRLQNGAAQDVTLFEGADGSERELEIHGTFATAILTTRDGPQVVQRGNYWDGAVTRTMDIEWKLITDSTTPTAHVQWVMHKEGESSANPFMRWDYESATLVKVMIGSRATLPKADSLLHVMAASAGTVTAYSSAQVALESDSNTGISLISPDNQSGSVYYDTPTGVLQGYLRFYGPTHATLAKTCEIIPGNSSNGLRYVKNSFAFQEAMSISTTAGALTLAPTTDVQITTPTGQAVNVGVSCNLKRFYAEITLDTTDAETAVGLTPAAVILSAAIRVSVEIQGLDEADHHIQLGINGTGSKYIDVAQGAAATTISVNKKGNYKFDPTTDTEAAALVLTITGGADQTPTAGKVYVEVIYLDSANLADV